jgi:hypothetical protein
MERLRSCYHPTSTSEFRSYILLNPPWRFRKIGPRPDFLRWQGLTALPNCFSRPWLIFVKFCHYAQVRSVQSEHVLR